MMANAHSQKTFVHSRIWKRTSSKVLEQLRETGRLHRIIHGQRVKLTRC